MFAQYTCLPLQNRLDRQHFVSSLTTLLQAEQDWRYDFAVSLAAANAIYNKGGPANTTLQENISPTIENDLITLLTQDVIDLDNLGYNIYDSLYASFGESTLEPYIASLEGVFTDTVSLLDKIIVLAFPTDLYGRLFFWNEIVLRVRNADQRLANFRYAILYAYSQGYIDALFNDLSYIILGGTDVATLSENCDKGRSFIVEGTPSTWVRSIKCFSQPNIDGTTRKYISIAKTSYNTLTITLFGVERTDPLVLGIPAYNPITLTIPSIKEATTFVISANDRHLSIHMRDSKGTILYPACLIGEFEREVGLEETYPSYFLANVSNLFTYTGETARNSIFNAEHTLVPYGDDVNTTRVNYPVFPYTNSYLQAKERYKHRVMLEGLIDPVLLNWVAFSTQMRLNGSLPWEPYRKPTAEEEQSYFGANSAMYIDYSPQYVSYFRYTITPFDVGSHKYPSSSDLFYMLDSGIRLNLNPDLYSSTYTKILNYPKVTHMMADKNIPLARLTAIHYDPPVKPAFSVQLPKLKGVHGEVVGKHAGLYTEQSLGLDIPTLRYPISTYSRGTLDLDVNTRITPKEIRVFNPGVEQLALFAYPEEGDGAGLDAAIMAHKGSVRFEAGPVIRGGVVLGGLYSLPNIAYAGGSIIKYQAKDYYLLRPSDLTVKDYRPSVLLPMEGASQVTLTLEPPPEPTPNPEPTPAPIIASHILRLFKQSLPFDAYEFWDYSEVATAWVHFFYIGGRPVNPNDPEEVTMAFTMARIYLKVDINSVSEFFYGMGAIIQRYAYYDAKYGRMLLGKWDVNREVYLASIPTFYKDLYTFLKLTVSGVYIPQLDSWATLNAYCTTTLPKLTRANRVEIYLSYKWGSFVNFMSPNLYPFIVDDNAVIEAMASMLNSHTHFFQRVTFQSVTAKVDAGFAMGELDNNLRVLDIEPTMVNFIPERDTPMTFLGGQFKVTAIDYSVSTYMPSITMNTWALFKPTEEDPSLTGPQILHSEIKHKFSLVMIHEAAHTIDYIKGKYINKALGFSTTPEWLAIGGWEKLKDQYSPEGDYRIDVTKLKYPSEVLETDIEPPVTPYGCSHPWEDFAEAWVMYKFNPAAMQQWYPKKHNYMITYVKPFLAEITITTFKANP